MLNGYLLLNKPANVSSYYCIQYIKNILCQKIKIGHTGTLDPFATGLLIICIGKEATQSTTYLLGLNKEYLVTAKLGELTDTLDKTGTVLQTCPIPPRQALEQAIQNLGTEYIQTPPIYSALKHKGQPLYKLARTKSLENLQQITEQKSRLITLHKLQLLSYNPPYFTLVVNASKGTYIRSLANDIAQKAGSCATSYELQRTHIGKISLEQAVDLTKIKTIDDISHFLLKKEHFSP